MLEDVFDGIIFFPPVFQTIRCVCARARFRCLESLRLDGNSRGLREKAQDSGAGHR